MANDKTCKEDALITAIHYAILILSPLPPLVARCLQLFLSLSRAPALSFSLSLHILTYTNVGENFQLGSLFLTQSMKCKTFICF